MAGGAEALAINGFTGCRVHAVQDSPVTHQIEPARMVDGAGDLRDAAADAPCNVGCGDIAGAPGADGHQDGLAVADIHIGHEFLPGQEPVMVFVPHVEHLFLFLLSFRRVGRQRQSETGMAQRQLGAERHGEIGGHLVASDHAVPVAVQGQERFPERLRVQFHIAPTALHGNGGKKVTATRDGNRDGLPGEAGDEPSFRACGRVVAGNPSIPEHHQIGAVVLFPDHRRGPDTPVVGSGCFPCDLTGGFIQGNDPGAAEFAVRQGCVIVQHENEFLVVQDGGCGDSIHALRGGDGLVPEFFPGVIVTQQAIGSEVGIDALFIHAGS